MRPLAAAALALALLLAGCSVGYQPGVESPTPTDAPATDAPTETPTPIPTGTPGAGDGTETATPTATPEPRDFSDPPTDELGWEDGYWYDEPVPVNATDGLNESELDAVVARSMARVEHVRRLEFNETVPVEVINRSTYRAQYVGGGANYSASFRTFDNVKFESLFLIGEDTDSLGVQNQNRGSNVLGFYSPRNDTIVIVSESDTPQLKDELTLAHELTHALQDQQFNLSRYTRPTREVYNAYNGLFEGDSHYIEQRYRTKCESEWECISVPTEGSGGGGGADIHFGVYFVNFFPYSDGPPFIQYHQQRGGWERINGMYEDPPNSTEQVIYPEKFRSEYPVNASFEDTLSGSWERVRPESPRAGQVRPDYAVFGQAGIAAMFAYTFADDTPRRSVIGPREFINYENGGQVNSSDPLNYGVPYASGWAGDRLHIYTSPDAGENETAYVWKTVWDSPEEAEEFAAGYRELLRHWGGERAGSANHWVIRDGQFEDAFYLDVEGNTVTVVNAPAQDDLPDVYADYAPPSSEG